MESATPIVAEFVHLDGIKVTDDIIGIGGTNIVIQKGEIVIKIPRLSRITQIDGLPVSIDQSNPPGEGDYDYRADLIRALENEKAIYRRIGPHVGITPCYNVSSTEPSVQMPHMREDLRHYLAKTRPDRKTQLAWLIQLADTIAFIHSRRVIVADVGAQNIVLDDKLNVKFVDFSESTLMALDWNLEGSDYLGYSIFSDIGFDVVNANNEVTWPPRDSFPSTDDVWMGHIIEKCWNQRFKSARDLASALKQQADSEMGEEGILRDN